MKSTSCSHHENTIRRVAGGMILLSVILTLTLHVGWIGLAAFVGLNLFQSSFTGFCPLEKMLDAREQRLAQTH